MPVTKQYNHVPRQIVTPYKPSEDIEQTPLLLPPTPTSPDSLQTASGYFPETLSGAFNNNSGIAPTNHNDNFGSVFDFPNQSSSAFSSSNPFVIHETHRQHLSENGAFTNTNMEEDSYTKVSDIDENFCWNIKNCFLFFRINVTKISIGQT